MKVRVIRAFKDAHDKNRLRFEGTIYEENLKRAVALNSAGFVELLEAKIETPEPPIPQEMETKKAGRPKGFTKVPKKKPAKKKTTKAKK